MFALRAQGDDVLALLLGGRARVRARVKVRVRVRVRGLGLGLGLGLGPVSQWARSSWP